MSAALLRPAFPLFLAVLFLSMTASLRAGGGTATLANSAWPNGPYLTGDWCGSRTRLENDGIDPYLIYTSIVAANVSGGVRQGGPEYAQDVNPGVTLDMHKLVHWDGATININGVDRIGHTIRPDVGSIYDPVQIYGGQTYTLYNVTLEQRFLDDKAALKIGRLSPGDDFAESPLYNYYVNNGIDGQIRAVIRDTRFKTYPFPVWGARLRFDPDPQFNLQTGLFEAPDRIADPANHGIDFALNSHDGIMLVEQLGWTPTFGEPGTLNPKSVPPNTGLPGHYFAGGWWSSADYPQFGTTQRTHISYGFYAHGDQMVYRPTPGSDTGLTLFGTAAYAPQPNISLIPFQLSGGALYQGLVPDRPADMSILGVIWGTFSDDYADTIEPQFDARATSEVALELGYRFQFTPFAYAQPDLQYVVQPGGTGNISNAFILAAQFGLTF